MTYYAIAGGRMQVFGKIVRVLAACCFASLMGCKAASFVFEADDLENAVITFADGANGHDSQTLYFDGTGAAGRFETRGFTYDFATQAAVDSNAYTSKTWFQNSGWSGTFTYDPVAHVKTMVYLDKWSVPAAAAPLSNGNFAAADYSYIDMLTSYYPAGTTSGSWTIATHSVIDRDGSYTVSVPEGSADTWIFSQTTVDSRVTNGVAYVDTKDYDSRIRIQDGSIWRRYAEVKTSTQDGAVTLRETTDDIYDYTIANFFLIGKDDKEGLKFSDAWKKGNKVSFNNTRTSWTSIKYQGNDIPPVPAIDPVTGIGGTNSGTAPQYYIDMNSRGDGIISLEHGGDYIVYTSYKDTAYRGLNPRPRTR